MTRTRQLLLSAALAATSTVLTFAAFEAAFRLRAALLGGRAFDPHGRETARPARGARVRLGQIIRPSSRLRVYELIPDLDVVFLNSELHTSPEGFRGPPLARRKPTGHRRIVGLGDSVMFGWGIAYADSFMARLLDRLGREQPGVRWEALNTAVPGYNTVMEVETLKEKGLAFSPDLVLLNVVGNDLGLPNFLLDRPDVLSWRRSFLLDFVRGRLGFPAGDVPRLEPVPTEVRRWWTAGGVERVPPALRGLAGLGAFRRSVSELAALGRERGFTTVLLAHPEAPDFAREAAAEHGFVLVETGSAVAAYAAAHGLASAGEPPLSLTAADPHPSALGHAIIAEALYDGLEGAGILRSLEEERPRPR